MFVRFDAKIQTFIEKEDFESTLHKSFPKSRPLHNFGEW